jgi:hypothetical protein
MKKSNKYNYTRRMSKQPSKNVEHIKSTEFPRQRYNAEGFIYNRKAR